MLDKFILFYFTTSESGTEMVPLLNKTKGLEANPWKKQFG